MIPPDIADSFSAPLRARGRQYHADGLVLLNYTSASEISATVRGTALYGVTIEVAPGVLFAHCDCPYALDNGECKHIWATLLEADSAHKLAPLLEVAGERAVFDTLAPDEPARPIRPTAREQRAGPPARKPPRTPPPPTWKSLLTNAQRQMERIAVEPPAPETKWPEDRRLIYVVDVPATYYAAGISIELATDRRTSAGEWEPTKAFGQTTAAWLAIPSETDRQIAQMLLGALPEREYGHRQRPSSFIVRGAAIATTLRAICQTGRCRVRRVLGEPPTEELRWDDGPAWRLRLRVTRQERGVHTVTAFLEREGEEMPLTEPILLHTDGVLLARGLVSRFEHEGAFALVTLFGEHTTLTVEASELGSLLESLHALPRLPVVELPPGTHVVERHEAPVPAVNILPDPSLWRENRRHLGLMFMYGDMYVMRENDSASVFDPESLTVHNRDRGFEAAALERLRALGARDEWAPPRPGFPSSALGITATKVAPLITELLGLGWQVTMQGVPYRAAGAPRAAVRSGIDWFELDAGVPYGEFEVSLHDLLQARRAGKTMITLPDGSQGLLPLEWLARLGPVVGGGVAGSLAGGVAGAAAPDGTLRFKRSQVTMLDALLATLPEASVDATFEKARTELRRFDSIDAANPASTFRGTLRTYQREGLGWLHFLRRFRLGGCLADDMGLGKTVQVLALLDVRRKELRKSPRPSIVVVPRSLLFNWQREAERFTPKLRVLEHTGTGRQVSAIDASTVDVVLTTYGTLRRDAAALAAIPFDYAILDEAQAIKNASSAGAKAARLLTADHRLAMTGTPVENRIEELWSLCEFLNPGMLGGASGFSKLVRGADREMLARALRPIILRRTKEQVASDLPKRSEQTLTVELEGAQRKFYDGLLAAYRRSVLERVDKVGVGKARMHILEALLRLRQAACHPVLADPRKSGAPSAKLDALMPALDEVIAQGHKALVFSQFTSFLALLRARLDAAGMPYEYLDGKVRDRQARVDRFQEDAECRLFLISLKAGGQGLNLTAADYVYILDPWWNPAVEAQAIDRAHRIGQTRHVLATRLVARGTIEEKILELQAGKRKLAEAILGEDQGVLAGIGREELEMLLG